MRGKRGFTLVEMMVAAMLLAVISVPIMMVFYFGITSVEKHVGETQAITISRETMSVIVDDLEKYSSNATKIIPEYDDEEREYDEDSRVYHEKCGERYYEDKEGVRHYEKQLVIRDDTTATKPKKVIYTYKRNVKNGVVYNRVLLREVDNVTQLLLSDSQLSDKYYTDVQKKMYDIENKEPVEFVKDNAQNRIIVYLRIKTDNKALAQESEYAHTVVEGGDSRQVLRFEPDGYICTDDSEKFNLYQSSFTIESYFKLNNISEKRCLVNLVGSDTKSKVTVTVKDKKLILNIGQDTTTNYKSASVKLVKDDDTDVTTNKWRKFVVVYDYNKKMASIYLTTDGDGGKLDTTPKNTTYFSTDSVFYGKKTASSDKSEPIAIEKIYLGNVSDINKYNGDDYVYMYEPRIWNKAIDVSKYDDKTKRLIGNEDGLLLYVKDNYRMGLNEDTVSLNIVNAVNNRKMEGKEVLVSEELDVMDTGTNEYIRNVLGY